jgi:8-amino-3,8-dideoxy-alpha-D-manno-octulosonate transaminase
MPGFEVIGSEELEQVTEVFQKSGVLFRHSFDDLRNGIYKVREFERAFAKYMSYEDALAVTSGTAALRVALAAAGVGKGDEVITQAFTFVATVEAIIESRAEPIIAEVDETLNMDPRDLEKQISDRTKAIIVVHMLGIPARMDQILPIARKHNLLVIEDTAWGCGAKLDGEYLGTIGDIGTFSFDFAKTMTTGEGGMILCKDIKILERAKAYHDHGHENDPRLPRWEDSRSGSGLNYRMMELQGAIGLAQLKKLQTVIGRQRANKGAIRNAIHDLKGIQFRAAPPRTEETADALVFFLPSSNQAKACRQELLSNGLGTKILPEAITWHFAGTWNHMPELTSKYPLLSEAFPKSIELLNRAVALPINVKMAEDVPGKIRQSLAKVLN